MSRRQLKSEDVDGFVRAFWDECRDTEGLYAVTIKFDIRRSLMTSGVSFHAAAERLDLDGYPRLVATARMDWPSPKYTSLHAMLYRLAMALNAEVQKEFHERTGEWYVSTPAEPDKK